jgi:hypothetical protein
MQHLYARLPDGTEHDFGPEKAALAASAPSVAEKETMIGSFVIAEMATRVGAGNVGEVSLKYNIREAGPQL